MAYVGPFLFPWGQPGSRRVFGIASALAEAGERVIVGAGQWGAPGFFPIQDSNGIEFCNLGDLPSPDAPTYKKVFQLFYKSGEKTVKWLKSMPSLPKCVIVYGAGAPYIYRVNKWCKSQGIPVVADVVEWYDSSHMTGGFFGPFHVSAKLAMHYYFPRCSGIFVISELLQRYYQKRSKASVIRVPPITDVVGEPVGEDRYHQKNEKIKLVYAGTPGKKDLLCTVVQGLSTVDPTGDTFLLQIMGPSVKNVTSLLGVSILPPFVEVLGRIPQELVFKKLKEADFSVLVREPKRFANAGFSTKFVESLMTGTPVIANHTSDMAIYLRDGVEGVVCADHTASMFANALKRVAEMPFENLVEMRKNARAQAIVSFDYRAFGKALSDFVWRLNK